MGTACEFVRRHFGWKVFVIRLLYRTFKEKLKIQGHYLFKSGFDFTTTCIMIVYKNDMKFSTNKCSYGSQNNLFEGILPIYSLKFIVTQKLTNQLSGAG